MPRRVVYSRRFDMDLLSAIDYIANELMNDIAAERLLNRTENEINRLAKSDMLVPKVYLTVDETDYCRLLVGNYVAIYTLENNVITMRRFYHGSQNITERLRG